jgi:predicted AAA+ superfamily ATPase
MLRSRKYNFIFIHVYKNAGTSITSALKPFSDNCFNKKFGQLLRLANINYFSSLFYPDHITASMLADKIGRQKFSSYFSFAIVRNPWDWQVSLYNYMLENASHHHQRKLVKSFKSFDDYIGWRCNEEIRYQKDFS